GRARPTAPQPLPRPRHALEARPTLRRSSRAVGMRSNCRFQPLLAVLLVGALAVVFFAPGIFRGQVPIFRDLLILVIPLRRYAKHAIAAGALPLWTDDLFWGAPFLANYQSAVFYPPSLLVYALPFALGFSVFLAFHVAIAGWGMTSYLERRCHLDSPS